MTMTNLRLKTRLDISFSACILLILFTITGLIAEEAKYDGSHLQGWFMNFIADHYAYFFPLCLLKFDSILVILLFYFLQLGTYLILIAYLLEKPMLRMKGYEPFLCSFYTISIITIGLIVIIFRAIYFA